MWLVLHHRSYIPALKVLWSSGSGEETFYCKYISYKWFLCINFTQIALGYNLPGIPWGCHWRRSDWVFHSFRIYVAYLNTNTELTLYLKIHDMRYLIDKLLKSLKAINVVCILRFLKCWKQEKTKYVWPGNTTSIYYRPTYGTARKSQETITTTWHSDHNKRKPTSSPLIIHSRQNVVLFNMCQEKQLKTEWSIIGITVMQRLMPNKTQLSQSMRFPTMWHVRPAKPQISLRIYAVWSEPLLVVLVLYEC